MIHPTAIVSDDVSVPAGLSLGPFALIGVDGSLDLEPPRIGRDSTVRSHTVVYRGSVIGQRFHAGHGALVRESSTIGNDVSLGSHSILEHHVSIADGVRIHSNAFVPEHSVIEAGAWLGPGVTVTNARYPNRPDTKYSLEGVHVGEGAVIGAHAVLLPGVRIGSHALIGAGTVVVRDVPPGATVVGNPGRPL